MKMSLFSVALFLGVNAFASVTFPTVLNCQQADGDEWLQFGLREVRGRTQVVVVQHHDDDTAELIARRYVTRSRGTGGAILWKDNSKTLQIQLRTDRQGKQTAAFTLLKDGPGSISESGLYCFKNGHISFDEWPHK